MLLLLDLNKHLQLITVSTDFPYTLTVVAIPLPTTNRVNTNNHERHKVTADELYNTVLTIITAIRVELHREVNHTVVEIINGIRTQKVHIPD